jgi:hypothetical protein
MMIRLGGSFPTNKAITVPVSIKVHHKNPKGIAAEPLPHAWITSDLRHDKACYMTTLLLPSIERTLRMSPQQVPLATLYARISFAPALINDRYSQIAVSIGCKSDGKGTASSAVVRGAIRVDFSLAIPIAHRERAFKRAFERWLSQASILEGKDHCKSVISTAFGALKWRGLDLWGLAFTNDYVLIDAARSFQDLITTTASMGVEERQDTLHQADPDTARLSESPQPDITAALGGPEAGAAQAEMFARLIPPLEYTYAEAEAVPYREWVSASHFWITPSGQEMDVHGARIVYLDESGAAALAGKNLRDGLPAELSNRRCHLVMRNYACGDRYTQDNTMRATQWWAPGDSDKNEDPNVKNSMPRFPRHTNCQGTWVHPPWLGPIMDMHAALDGSEPFPPRRGGRPNGGRSVPRHENPDGGGQETDQGRLL